MIKKKSASKDKENDKTKQQF